MQSLRVANLRTKLNLRLLQTAASAAYNNNTASAQSDASSSEKNDDDTQTATLTDDTFTKEFMARKIQISDLQRTILAIGSSISSIIDPRRHDMIAALGETTGVETLKKLYDGMYNCEEGRRILNDKPRINTKTVDFELLKRMPENTLGFLYYKFLADNVNFLNLNRDIKII
jgi:ubiquinone biosynthesis protein COQ4